jgi:myo-inositol-1(or 4)-monophosphatase
MSFFACCSRTHQRYAVSIPYKSRILGSAAYNFCMLARGSACVSFEAAPKIWDIAAAWLLVQEAGGTIAAYMGEPPFPILPMKNYASIDFPTLAAASQELFSKCMPLIQSKSIG